ncbi:MAG: diphthine synthase [Candidatus Altiarchaeales archaeon WOR_SM1_79]|nr:MAG: diphthine synthase [Candidatus Altiarchaeales archaeon WOR_SM1_79]
MGELIFIGLGLYDERDISLNGLETARDCDILFAEFYTSKLTGTTISQIESLIGRKITILNREEMEKGDIIIEAAKENKVGVLVAGDPMTATTHMALRMSAKQEGLNIRIVHGTSIITSAPALSGLHIYKFGSIASLPFPKKGYFPTSPYDIIKLNLDCGLHTLILLDIDEEVGKLMRANEALKILLDMESEKKEGIISGNTLVCVLGSVGSKRPVVRADYLNELLKEDFGEGLNCLIIPGKLHFTEVEALVELAGAPKAILARV